MKTTFKLPFLSLFCCLALLINNCGRMTTCAIENEDTRPKEQYAPIEITLGPAEMKIRKTLDSTIDIELDDTKTFGDLFNMLKEKNPGINIAVDPRGAGAMGIQLSSSVVREAVSYRGIKLRSALRLILGGQDLTYCITDEVLLITSEEEALKHMSARIYPIEDLMKRGGDMEELMEIIEAIVAPDSWAANGGYAEMAPFGDKLLIVRQLDEVHTELENLFAALRQALDAVGAVENVERGR
ncbi:MAG: hypothetical protein FWE67_05715 [Planctomycetaceae bacterium]|nr:hypothetical protein [Planctomycetaceae bacterium]